MVYGVCLSCKKEYAPPNEDECSTCYLAPFGTAWEQEMEERVESGWF